MPRPKPKSRFHSGASEPPASGRTPLPPLALPGEPGFDWFGELLAVPDKYWGFAAVGRIDHPGVMLGDAGDGRNLLCFKGAHAEGRRRLYNDLLVEPDGENGLSKATLFQLEPHRLSRRAAELMHHERRMGRLGAADSERLRGELLRVLGPDTGLGEGP